MFLDFQECFVDGNVSGGESRESEMKKNKISFCLLSREIPSAMKREDEGYNSLDVDYAPGSSYYFVFIKTLFILVVPTKTKLETLTR